MELIPEWAPNFHPMVVHFPLALLSIALLFDLLTFLLPEKAKTWARLTTLSLYVTGALTAIGVYFTGQAAADSVFMPAEAQSVLNSHADWALLTVWFYSIYTVLRLLAVWIFREIHRMKVHVVFFILSMVGVFMLYETGEYGAQMVFQHGVGVQASEEVEEKPTTLETEEEQATTFVVSDDGDWSWEIGPNGVSALLNQFQWLEGSVQDLQPQVVTSGDNHLLNLSLNSSANFFVQQQTFQNVQVDYNVDLSNFEGTVSLVNHVQDEQNYDFVALSSDGTISQGRVSNGEREVFAEEQYSDSGMLFIRTVANGTHFRGYINKEMVVHGHGDAPEAGKVGLRLEGSGTLIIDSVTMTQLN